MSWHVSQMDLDELETVQFAQEGAAIGATEAGSDQAGPLRHLPFSRGSLHSHQIGTLGVTSALSVLLAWKPNCMFPPPIMWQECVLAEPCACDHMCPAEDSPDGPAEEVAFRI